MACQTSHDLSQLRKFVSPEIIFDAGCRRSIANYMKTFSACKVLLVSDPDVLATGWVADIQAGLEGQGIDYRLYTDVSPDPWVDEAMFGTEFCRNESCNVIVVVGGDSPMDCARGIGTIAARGRSIFEFGGVDRLRVPSPPLTLIPTTIRTSADVSQFAVISNRDEHMKFSVVGKTVVSDVSLIDPETALTMSPFLSACTGIDALIHAIKAFVFTGHGPLTGPRVLEAMRLIDGNLVQMTANPSSIALREKIVLRSMQAGLTSLSAILSAVHAMSHNLDGCLDLSHGLCSAAPVEHVVVFNYSIVPERLKVIVETLGIDHRGLVQGQAYQHLVDHLIASKHAVGFHESLTLHGVGSSDIPFLSRHAIQDLCILTNPCESSQRDAEVVYGEAL